MPSTIGGDVGLGAVRRRYGQGLLAGWASRSRPANSSLTLSFMPQWAQAKSIMAQPFPFNRSDWAAIRGGQPIFTQVLKLFLHSD